MVIYTILKCLSIIMNMFISLDFEKQGEEDLNSTGMSGTKSFDIM